MMQAFTHRAFHDHQHQVNRLLVTMQHLHAITEHQALSDLPDELAQRIKVLHDNQLTILFTGAICSGKRTVINALLELNLLPLYPVPLQDVPIVIFWGEEAEVHIHYRPRPDGTTRAPHTAKLAHLERDLFQVLTTTSKTKESYECIVIQYPHSLLAAGLTIIDLPCHTAPRRDNHQVPRMQQMMRYLKKADAVVYVQDCSVPPTKDEDLLIECIRHIGHSAPFFLCNQIDRVDPHRLQEVRIHATRRLSHLTGTDSQNIFFTDARAALSGCLHNQPEQIIQSNILDVEAALTSFLTTCWQERLHYQVTMLKIDILTTIHLLEQREQALQGTRDQVDRSTLKTYLDGFKRIEALTTLRGRIMEPILQHRATFTKKFDRVAREYEARILAKVETWTQQYTPEPVKKHDYGYVGNPRERFVKGLSVFLARQVRKEAHSWLIDNCYPLIKEELATIARHSEKPVEQFIKLQHEFHYALQSSKLAQTRIEPIDVLDRAVWQITQEQQINEDAGEIIALIEQDMNITWPITALIENMLAYTRANFVSTSAQQYDEQAIRQLIGMHYQELLQRTFPEGQRHALAFITEMLDKKQTHLVAQLHLFETNLHTTIIEQIDAHRADAHQRQQILEHLEQDITKLWNMYDEIDEHGDEALLLR